MFDYIHFGHIRLFKSCKRLGDSLIVAVQNSNCVYQTKPDANLLYSDEDRLRMVFAFKPVDVAIVYRCVDDIVREVDFDIFCVGEDQKHEGFQHAIDWCINHNKGVTEIKRTPGISSSSIKKEIIN